MQLFVLFLVDILFAFCIVIHLKRPILDVAMPVIEQKSDEKFLNWTQNATVTLDCQIRGQAGMQISWKRDDNILQGTSFEKVNTKDPEEPGISAVAKTQIKITYKNSRNIYDNFNCIPRRNNSGRLLCKSIYSCLASYPDATTPSQGDIPVIITPDIGTYECVHYYIPNI